MLLKNCAVEEYLMNGSIGVVKEIVYENSIGPTSSINLPAYIIVDFPKCTVPEVRKLLPNKPRTFVPIPTFTSRCKKRLLYHYYSSVGMYFYNHAQKPRNDHWAWGEV